MLTARRLHEKREREAAGLPDPPPRAPDSIPFHEHETALRELSKRHAAELKAVVAAAGGGPVREGLVDETLLEEVRAELNEIKGELGAALDALAAEVGMAEIRNVRRYYLHKRLTAEGDLGSSWQAKQEAEPGTPLEDGFPFKADLASVGYTTEEDLDGADQAELERVGFKANQAKKIIAALA